MRRTGRAHLIFLLEAIALCCLHLVDMLQKVSHPYCRVQLSCVIRGALPATRAPRGAPQEAAGLGDPTASLVSCSQRKGNGLSHIYANPAWKPLDGLRQSGGREQSQYGGWPDRSLESSLARQPCMRPCKPFPSVSLFPIYEISRTAEVTHMVLMTVLPCDQVTSSHHPARSHCLTCTGSIKEPWTCPPLPGNNLEPRQLPAITPIQKRAKQN